MKNNFITIISILFLMLINSGCQTSVNENKTEAIIDTFIEEEIDTEDDFIEESYFENTEFETYDTLDNWLMLGIGEDFIIDKLGKPLEKGEDTYWGAIGTYVQRWSYAEDGIELEMESDNEGEAKRVLMITIVAPCQMKTSKNIGIGEDIFVVDMAYKDNIDKESSNDTQIVVGSVYGGVIFNFENGYVTSIFIGAAAE